MNLTQAFSQIWNSTGISTLPMTWPNLVMLVIGCVLLYLAIKKGFEPLLLVPIGFGCLLANIPLAGITDEAPPQQEYAIYLREDFNRDKLVDIVLTKMVHDESLTEAEAKAAGEKKLNDYAEEFRQATVSADFEEGKLAFEPKEERRALIYTTEADLVPTPAFLDFLSWKKEIAIAGFNAWYIERCKATGQKLPSHPYSVSDGFLMIIYRMGVATGLFPLIIFMGVGAMTDFGPLLANPKTALLGAAAQFGIFATLIGTIILSSFVPGLDYGQGMALMKAASAIGIIGGADGPTAIYTASKLAPHLMGAIAVAAYSYMALVPIIQPPIMRKLTTKEERAIEMKQLRHVTKLEKIVFPLIVLGLCAMLLPSACPLIGALMFGNLAKESGVVGRLSDTMQNALINIVTIFLGLSVGMKLAADKFLKAETLGILALGLAAFAVGTATGIIMAKIMNKFSKDPINPLIGSAGVSAVPMAARVSNKVGQEENPHNFLLMHAMGPNVAGVIGSAVAAGILIALCGG